MKLLNRNFSLFFLLLFSFFSFAFTVLRKLWGLSDCSIIASSIAMSEGYVLGAEENKKSYNVESGQAKFTKVRISWIKCWYSFKLVQSNDDVNVKAQTKLIGLTKEQLEQYRNDPFWKPVRYLQLF